jgi:beta-aspartyl-dipeptidase (metallo-type)
MFCRSRPESIRRAWGGFGKSANPARRIGAFSSKGTLTVGKDADLLILSPDWEIESLMAKGRFLIHQNQILVEGTLEKGT